MGPAVLIKEMTTVEFTVNKKDDIKAKGKANQNATKVNGGEISQSAEQSAQHSLEQVLWSAGGKKENAGNPTSC